ncbi:MAG: acyl--CoA ligase [Burkholderiales bacterium]|nr:acyl--CoA ligase [Burkholderiales bacterium]
METIVARLIRHAETRPDALAYADAGTSLSYSALRGQARAAAAWLHHRGVRAGDSVATLLGDASDSALPALRLCYGIAWLGASWLPCNADIPAARRREILGAVGVRWFLASGGEHAAAGASALDAADFDASHARLLETHAPRRDAPGAPFLYRITSGTTGAPKICLLSAGQWAASRQAAALAFGSSERDRVAPPRPWPESAALSLLGRSHWAGGAFVNVAVTPDLGELRAVVERFGITELRLSPYQLRALLRDPEVRAERPLPLRLLYAGGGAVTPEDVRAARRLLAPRFGVEYGTVELGGLAFLGPDDPAEPRGCAGRINPGVEAQALGEDGLPLAAGQTGLLRFRTPWMPQGYAANPQASAERFRDGWFYPGDIGSLDASGRLFVLGRSDDVINWGGVKIAPSEVEAVLRRHADIEDCAVLGLPDALSGQRAAAFVVLRRPEAVYELPAFCVRHMDASRQPRAYYTLEAIPRNANAKVLGERLREFAAAREASLSQPGAASPAGPRPAPAAGMRETLTARLHQFARVQPEAPAFVHSAGSVSYAALKAHSIAAAAWLRDAGVRAGEAVALDLDSEPGNALACLWLFYGLAHLGAPILPLYPNFPGAARERLVERLRPRWRIGGPAPQARHTERIDASGLAQALAGWPGGDVPRADHPERACLYHFTSGTTGEAKLCLYTGGQIAARVRSNADALGSGPGDRVAALLAWPNMVALRVMLQIHSVGGALVYAGVPESREELAKFVRASGLTELVVSPYQLRLLLASPATSATVPLRLMSVSGGLVTPDEILAARRSLTPNFCVDYGTNELGRFAVLGARDAVGRPGCVGRIVQGIEAQAVDRADRPLPPGTTGALRFRTPWIPEGYVGNEAASRERFRNGWFYPGDAGSIDARGYLIVTGRTDDAINYGGVKIYPAEVEAVLRQHPEVLDCALVGVPHPMSGQVAVAFVVLRRWEAQAELRAWCAQRMDQSLVPANFCGVETIERSADGKVARERLREHFLARQQGAGAGR